MADKDVYVLGIPKCRLEDGTEADILMDIPLTLLDSKLTEDNKGYRVYNKKAIYDESTTPHTLLYSKGWYEVTEKEDSTGYEWKKVSEGGGSSIEVDDETIKKVDDMIFVNLGDQFSASSEGIKLSGPVPAGSSHTIEFAVDETDPSNPIWGYKKDGADTVIPFKTGGGGSLVKKGTAPVSFGGSPSEEGYVTVTMSNLVVDTTYMVFMYFNNRTTMSVSVGTGDISGGKDLSYESFTTSSSSPLLITATFTATATTARFRMEVERYGSTTGAAVLYSL